MTIREDRERRLADELRRNLHRRKAQARAIADAPVAPSATAPGGEDQSGAV